MSSSQQTFEAMAGGDWLGANQGRFASPWVDLATQYAPRTFRDALTLCEYLYVNNSTYRKASERVVSYFLTKVNLSGQSDNELDKFDKILNQKFDAIGKLKEMGEDYMCYGNAFASIIPAFRRMLRCVKCSSATIIDKVNYEFRFNDLSFHAKCGKCDQITRHMVHDYADPNPDKIRLVRWDPKKITIEYNDITGDTNYWLEIDSWIGAKIRTGDKFFINTTPWSFIQAIHRSQKYKFNKEYFYHMKEGCLAGIRLYGWGLPSILSSFKNFFRLQVMLRYDETLMMDYIVPMRIISPQGVTGNVGNDIMAVANMENFRNQFASGVVRHRLDGADWNFFPFPVNYQAIGGEGKNLSPADLIRNEEDRLLNARGFPPELYRGTLTLQAASVGLRLFERSWEHFVSDLNGSLQWMATTVARLTRAGDIEAELESSTLTDDLEAKQLRLNLMSAQQISKSTALAPFGIDAAEERKRILDEAKEERRSQAAAQQEMEMEQMSLGGDASEEQQQGQGGSNEATPMDVQSQGEEIAQNLVNPQMSNTQRRQELNKIRQSNPTLHAVVVQAMEKMRQQAGMQGRDGVLQQQANQTQAPSTQQ